MTQLTGTIVSAEVQRFTPFVRDYYAGPNTEVYEAKLLVTIRTAGNVNFAFRSPAVSWRITTVPGVAVSTCGESEWMQAVPCDADKWVGMFPRSRVEVGQRITISYRTNAKGYPTHVKLVEALPVAEEVA